MPPTTYMIEKQAELDAYQIVNKVVKARLPKGCSFDKVSTLWRVENHSWYLLEPVMGSTGRPRYYLVLLRCCILSNQTP